MHAHAGVEEQQTTGVLDQVAQARLDARDTRVSLGPRSDEGAEVDAADARVHRGTAQSRTETRTHVRRPHPGHRIHDGCSRRSRGRCTLGTASRRARDAPSTLVSPHDEQAKVTAPKAGRCVSTPL
jgi:hypothetical protein